ncbi:MAG: hypothetical protein L0Z70_11730 [Chloroflexi bacterium]|nr:hypothetical protein [Chloroflexota bacterium]
MRASTALATLVASANEIEQTRRLIGSLRAFGGGMKGLPVWVFAAKASQDIDENLLDLEQRSCHCSFFNLTLNYPSAKI